MNRFHSHPVSTCPTSPSCESNESLGRVCLSVVAFKLRQIITSIKNKETTASQANEEIDRLWQRISKLQPVTCTRRIETCFCKGYLSMFQSKDADEIVKRFKIAPSVVLGYASWPSKNGTGVSNSMAIKYLRQLSVTGSCKETNQIAHLALFGTSMGDQITDEWLNVYDVCVKLLNPSSYEKRKVSLGNWQANMRNLVDKWTIYGIDPMSRLLSPVAWRENNADTCRDEMTQCMRVIEQAVGHDIGSIVWRFCQI